MRRAIGDNAVCLESLEKELASCPETYGYLDLIAFGCPCQDMSQANSKGKGLSGGRSGLFFEAMRIVKILNPKWLLIENVPRLLSINDGRDMAVVLQTLAVSGYGWSYRVLDTQYFGCPQRRKRIFIVGRFGGQCPPEILFEQAGGRGDGDAVKKVEQRGLCISTRDGQRQDPKAETLIASIVKTSDSYRANARTKRNLVASSPCVAGTIGSNPRGDTSFVWQDTYIA